MQNCSTLRFRIVCPPEGLNQAYEITLRIFKHGEGVSMSNLLIAKLLCSDGHGRDGKYGLPAKISPP